MSYMTYEAVVNVIFYVTFFSPVFHIQALCLLISGDHEASHLQEVFPPRLQSHTPLPHHRELC